MATRCCTVAKGRGDSVCNAFETQVAFAECSGDKSLVQAAIADTETRQRQYLKRKPWTSWKPRKRYRLASRRFVVNLDNQIRQVSNGPGLRYFLRIPDATEGCWQNWRTWPHLALSTDQGEMCAQLWMRQASLNFTPFFDFAHGSKNDHKLMLGDVNQWNWWLMYMVHLNVTSGPQQDGTCWNALKQSWEAFVARPHTPVSRPLFTARAGDIRKDLGESIDLPGVESVEKELWAWCQSWIPTNSIKRVNLNRFWDIHQAAKQDLLLWHLQLVNAEFLALEEGMLTDGVLKKFMVRGTPSTDDESTSRTSHVDKSLKLSGSNAVVVRIGMLSDPDNNAVLRILITAAEPTRRWYSNASTDALRSVNTSSLWLADQSAGNVLTHIMETFDLPSQYATLEYCRFDLPWDGTSLHGWSDIEDEIQRQNQLMALLGDSCMAMSSRRFGRIGWLLSFPYRTLLRTGFNDSLLGAPCEIMK